MSVLSVLRCIDVKILALSSLCSLRTRIERLAASKLTCALSAVFILIFMMIASESRRRGLW